MIGNKETIAIGWCDNGITEGKFTEGLLKVTLTGPEVGFPVSRTIRVQGNQIARQRQALIDNWYDSLKTDWLVWVDSDIVLTNDIWFKLLSTANKNTHPIVSGVYFIAKETDGSLPVIVPCIFDDIDEYSVKFHHPLPVDQIIKVDSAGMGLVVMHRSIVTKLRQKFGNEVSLFGENNMSGEKFIGEDIAFFRKCKEADIPVYAHTGAIAQHIKRVAWDTDYYIQYWSMKNLKDKLKEEQASKGE